MFFVISKIVAWFLSPINIISLLIILGVITFIISLKHGKTFIKKSYQTMFATAFIIILCFATMPIGHWLVQPLEERFIKTSPIPPDIDGIIVLGGSINVDMSYERNQIHLNNYGGRLLAFIDLAHNFKYATLLYTGGNSSLINNGGKTEAEIARNVLRKTGIKTNRIIFEDQSRNTFENVIYSKKMINPQPNEKWLLITSAIHMPRSIGIFKKQKWNVIPHPVDFQTFPGEQTINKNIDIENNMRITKSAMKEWVGLIAYYLTDKTTSIFPSM